MLADRVRMGVYSGGCDDTSGSPGECNLIAGNMDAGYFGLVNASELWNSSELLSMFGFRSSAILFDNDGWFKFAHKGKVLFIRRRPIASFSSGNVNIGTLRKKELIYGLNKIDKNGITYKVRLPTGLRRSPSSIGGFTNQDAIGSEMSDLFKPLMNGEWANYTPANLRYEGANSSAGSFTVTQNYGSIRQRFIYRWAESLNSSDDRVDEMGELDSNYKYGWRPVLEVVE